MKQRPSFFFNRIYLSVLFSLVLFNFATNPVSATTYYVDNISGLNTNDGLSTGAAWLTLAQATSVASAGDTVNIINNGPLYPFRERLAPARDGTSGGHIRFLGYNGSPILLGTVDYSHSVSTGWLWHASATSGEYYLTKNDGDPGISAILPRVLATSTTTNWAASGVDALNSRVTGTIGSLEAGQWNWGNNDSLGYNTVYYRLASGESDITTVHIEGGEDSAQRRNPILVAWEYIDIENFKVRFSNHHGILNQTKANYDSYNYIDSSYTGRSGISNGIFSNMVVTNSRFDHNGMLSTTRADYTGIQLSGTTNCTIKNNVISNGNNDSGINIKTSSSNNLIENNIIFNNPQHGIDISINSLNNTVYNNTIYNNVGNGINMESASTGNTIKNNVIANNQGYQLSIFDSGSTTGLTSNYNSIYFSNSATNTIRYVGSFYSLDTFTTYQFVSGQDANSIILNPNFLNASGNLNLVGDFKLLSISPLINAGTSVGVTTDYASTAVPQGNTPDIGAYEFILPNAPTSLAQYEADGITAISSEFWINDTTVVLKFNMSSTNGSDSLTPQVEIQEVGTAFGNSVTNSGTAVAYVGSPVGGEVTISGLTNGITYHWQARISNAAGAGAWLAMGGSPDFGIDTSTPTGGSITYSDGNQTSTLVSLTVNDGTDSSSGLNTATRLIKRRSSILSAGICGSYGSYSTVTITGSYPNFTDSTVLIDNCYQYEYLISDNAGNQATYSSINIAKINIEATTNSNSSSSSSSNISSSTDTSCYSVKPTSIPDLFQIDVNNTTAKLFFTPSLDSSEYYISFSTNKNAEGNGVRAMLKKEGVQNFTVNFLKPNTIYYFKVRNQNGCNPGDWSNIFIAKTRNKETVKITQYYKKTSLIKSSPLTFLKKTLDLSPMEERIQTSKILEPISSPPPEIKNDASANQKKCYLWGWFCFQSMTAPGGTISPLSWIISQIY